MSDLISVHHEMPLMRGIKSVMFCAHDEDEHAVCWSPVAETWRLENIHGRTEYYPQLCQALTALHYSTGIDAPSWTITDNPY